MFRRIAFVAAFATGLLFATPAFGQSFRIIPKAALDSLAHPVAASDSPMRFEQTTIHAGTLNEEDAPATYTFDWTNVGDEPVVITEVRTGCGCVKAMYDFDPVKPGAAGTIAVTYYPKGHPGNFQRKIQVYTQAGKLPAALLTLTGTVTPSAVPVHDYPHAMGPLRLKQKSVRIPATTRSIERIEMLNAGEAPLRLTVRGELLPDCLTVRFDPATIPAGTTADLEIGFDPEKVRNPLPKRLPILVEGLALPPGQRTIYVDFE